MKPIQMQTVRSLVFKSEETIDTHSLEITAIFNETKIKVKTNKGEYIGEVIKNLMYGHGFGFKTEFGKLDILFEDIEEIFYYVG